MVRFLGGSGNSGASSGNSGASSETRARDGFRNLGCEFQKLGGGQFLNLGCGWFRKLWRGFRNLGSVPEMDLILFQSSKSMRNNDSLERDDHCWRKHYPNAYPKLNPKPTGPQYAILIYFVKISAPSREPFWLHVWIRNQSKTEVCF